MYWFLVFLALHIVLVEHCKVLLLEPSQIVDHKNHLVRNPGQSTNRLASPSKLGHQMVEKLLTLAKTMQLS